MKWLEKGAAMIEKKVKNNRKEAQAGLCDGSPHGQIRPCGVRVF
ncbi:MAG: hypothetical protein ACOX4O_12845 [Eubacteriales bacterium]